MEKTNWKVEGMTCSNCALTVTRFLEKEGRQNVQVSLITGDVSFDKDHSDKDEHIIKGIEGLGYTVHAPAISRDRPKKKWLRTHLHRFLFCAVFTLPLMLHMFERYLPIHWLMNPWLQLGLCVPVYIVGMDFFGRSAVRSIRNGLPNMNVLIAIGATAAFVYSLIGTLAGWSPGYLFYETSAAIITLVFLGNHLEETTISSTQRELTKLARTQQAKANMIAFNEDHEEIIFPVDNDQLRSGDLILIRSGEQVPADCKILTGQASVDESIITGESLPLQKNPRDSLIGGSLVTDGLVKAQVSAAAGDSVLANIVNLVRQTQGEKPPVQQLADKISAIFVPTVLAISGLTFIVNLILLQENAFTASLMRAIAVLVIACPCAMGLATPAAIAVGLGRAARNGILFRNAKSLELFKNIRQAVFDKTGTLTTGRFSVAGYRITDETLSEEEFKKIVFSLEKYSNHPLAKSLTREWKQKETLRWTSTEEIKGVGMRAFTKEGDQYEAGSYAIAGSLTTDDSHNVYVVRNGRLLGWIDLQDEIRPEGRQVVRYLQTKGIRTLLVSGDRFARCKQVADQLGIEEIIAEQTPAQKLEVVQQLTAQAPTLMVGDGINDAPALAKATIGMSLSEASQIAMQTADVVLMNSGIRQVPLALGLGKHTFITIRQNLFWAFFYNIIAIPVAALGFLTPAFGALVMGLSDVVLGINSVRLYVKRVS